MQLQTSQWQGRPWRQLVIPALLILGGVAALSIDVPVSRVLLKEGALNRFDKVFEVIEKFGHALAVGLIILTIGVCDATRRRAIPRLLAASMGAGLAADVVKLCVGRVRPLHYDFAGTAFDTFLGWLPGIFGGPRGQSFPSAHVATAFGFALALGALFPNGRRLFVLFAALVAFQRVEDGAHFLSDTLWGAAIGYLWAIVIFRKSLFGGWFDRWESGVTNEVPLTRSTTVIHQQTRPETQPTAFSLAQAGIKKLSLVVPVFNEQENIPHVYSSVHNALEDLNLDYELIFVDDGSTDGSTEQLQKLAARDSRVKVATFRRNFGQTAAMNAGIHLATGDVIALLDGDLQNDPTDIPMMLGKIAEGYDLVHGWRKDRHDRFLDRRLPSLIANWIISRVTGFPVHDLGCTLKVIRREIAQELHLYGEMHRFIPILASCRGAKCAEVVTKHHPRRFGTSKYGISRTIRVILDLITVKFLTHYFVSPMRLFGKLGLSAVGVGGMAGLATIAMKVLQGTDMTGNPLLLGSVFSTLLGMQFLCLGVLGEVAVRTYYESQQQVNYAIRHLMNFDDEAPVSRAA